MRLTVIGVALLAAGCAGNPTTDNSQPINRTCGIGNCFFERDVRGFEVINHTTLIVYVGSERCPFQVELLGTFCDLSFAGDIYFNSPSEPVHDSDLNSFAGSPESRLRSMRICSNDISIGVSGGALADNPNNNQPSDRNGNQRSDCQISSVESLTDDELVELYVRRGVLPPPPPMGSGQIQVGDQKDGENPERAPDNRAPTEPGGVEEGAATTPRLLETAAAATPR